MSVDIAFFGGKAGLFAVDALTGDRKWTFPTSAAVSSNPVIRNNLVIFGCADGRVIAVDISTARQQWTLQTPNREWHWYPLNARGEWLCFGCKDKNLYVVNAMTGDLKMKIVTDGKVTSNPCIESGFVFFGSQDGTIYSVNLTTGHESWRFTKEDLRPTSVALAKNPRIIKGMTTSDFPLYSQVSHVMEVLTDKPRTSLDSLISSTKYLSGTRDNPFDWEDYNNWIPKELDQNNQNSAMKIWDHSTGKELNGRELFHLEEFIFKIHGLMCENEAGNLIPTLKGHGFLKNDPVIVATMDEREGMPYLLSILETEKSPVKFKKVFPIWKMVLVQHGIKISKTAAKDEAKRRLKNLIERDYVAVINRRYGITQAGKGYLSSFGFGSSFKTEIPRSNFIGDG